MKILFDHQIFTWQKQGGISRYFAEIIYQISTKKDLQYKLSLLNSNNTHLLEIGIKNNLLNQLLSHPRITRSRFKQYIDKINLNKTINTFKKQKFDVFVPTYFDTYFLEFLNNKPFVLTVYDMIHELYPTYFTGVEHLIDQKKILIHKANKIIAISENTKKDILNIYPTVDEKKIEVVYLSHSIKTIQTTINIELPKKYILFVGERGAYKNFDFFIKSASNILNNDKNIFVLCVGGRAFTSTEVKLFDSLNIQNQMLQYTASDSELYTLYNRAMLFVFPSLYEGFGIPVLEAMASKCPVILTNASSFPEVAQDAALYFNVDNKQELEKNLNDLIYNEENRLYYVEKGLENVKRFSWKKTTDNCIEIFKSVV